MRQRTAASASAVALLGLISITAAALAEPGFHSTKLLRTAPTGAHLRAADMQAKGDAIVVGWEEQSAGQPAVYLRWSVDGGSSFMPKVRLDTRPNREVQVDTCGGWAYAASALHVPGDPANWWDVTLDGRDLDGSGFEGQLISSTTTARHPDVACVGSDRLAVAWLETTGELQRGKLYVRGRESSPKGDNLQEYSFNLGQATPSRGLSMAATSSRIYVSWFDGTALRFRTYAVGSDPSRPVASIANVTIADLPYGSDPQLAASDSRVVLAYTNRADLSVRRSTNKGATFGSAKTLLDEPFPSEIGAVATTVDSRGARVLIEAAEIGSDGVSLLGRGISFISEDDGAHYSQVDQHAGGRHVGALARSTKRIAEAWDQWIDDPNPEHLRFHIEN